MLPGEFCNIDSAETWVILIEAQDRMLTHLLPNLSQSTRRQLERLGIEVRVGENVQEIRGGLVLLDEEEIETSDILWPAGVRASPLSKSLGVETDKGGRIKVLHDLIVHGYPNVFVAGDIAAATDGEKRAVPGVVSAALQMARDMIRIIAGEINGTSVKGAPGGRPLFVYREKGPVATIGRFAAVAQNGSLKLSGSVTWRCWLVLHLISLIGFRDKLAVLLQWL